ncbi:MAG: MoaD/ThiS family protein [Limnochordia bacterium]
MLQAGEVQDPLIELRPDKTGWQVFYQGELTLAQLLANLQLELPPGHQVLRDRRMIQGEEILRNGDRIVILPVPLAGG